MVHGPGERKALKAQGFKVIHSMRELGGHLQLTRAMTNATLSIKELESMWPKLLESPAPRYQKLRAIATAAWPRGLHGISICSVGSHHFQALRAAAMKAVGCKRPGANAKLQFSMVEFPTLDPEFVALRESLWDLRCHAEVEEVGPILDHPVSGQATWAPGPCRVLLDRIHQIGWRWVAGRHKFQDSISEFCLWDLALQELLHRMAYAWQRVVADQVSQRAGFGGLGSCDACLTRLVVRRLPPMQQSYVRLSLNGTHFTMNASSHMHDGVSSACRFCGEEDGQERRFKACLAFQDLRAQTGYGGGPRGRRHGCHLALAAIPEPHLPRRFTRLASWAVLMSQGNAVRTLAAGALPRLRQSVFCAELFAVWTAAPFRVWSACLGVVKKVRRLQDASFPPRGMDSNGDLWSRVSGFQINHVPSHQNLDDYEDPAEAWVLTMNAEVDCQASQACFQRPTEFWDLWQCYKDQVREESQLQEKVVALHVKVVERVTRQQPQPVFQPAQAVEIRGDRPFRWPATTAPAARVVHQPGRWYTDLVMRWLLVVTDGTDEELAWIPWIHGRPSTNERPGTGSIQSRGPHRAVVDACTRTMDGATAAKPCDGQLGGTPGNYYPAAQCSHTG